MRAVMQPGRYFIGDPCHCFSSQEKWLRLLDDLVYFNSADAVKWPGLVADNTANGDGTYEDNRGNSYSVEAGVIGVTHERCWEVGEERLSNLGCIVEFEREFIFETNSGQFKIDGCLIDTNCDDFDDCD